MVNSSPLHAHPLLKMILSLAELPVLVFDTERQLHLHSPAALTFFPQLRTDLHCELWEAAEYPSIEAAFSQMRAGSETVEMHFIKLLADDSEPRHLSWKGQALRSPDGELQGFALVGTDQTYKERLELELQRSFRLVRDHKMALDESSIVAITDKRGVIQYVNDTFCRISGYTREELLGQTHAILKSGHHGQAFFKDLWQTIGTGRVWKGEIQNCTKDGQIYWVDTTIVPFCNENGRPYQYVAIRNDITEKKLIQENLESERMRTTYAEKMASLGELAAGIAHELGNPAASINAWLDVIEAQHERGSLDLALFMQTVPKVRRDAKRIRDIIRGMLAYARDGSRDPFQSESPQVILQQVVDYCSYKLRKCSVQVQLEVPHPYLTFDCRSTEISQLFVNFILNACDAVEALSERWITIAVVDLGEQLVFRIMDSGKGIPSEIAEQIFKPFFTTKSIGKGTGLGLSIARAIVENHGGSIGLDTTAAHTCFVITLPKRQLAPDAEFL